MHTFKDIISAEFISDMTKLNPKYFSSIHRIIEWFGLEGTL